MARQVTIDWVYIKYLIHCYFGSSDFVSKFAVPNQLFLVQTIFPGEKFSYIDGTNVIKINTFATEFTNESVFMRAIGWTCVDHNTEITL